MGLCYDRCMTIILSENFRALFYAPFYAAHASGAFKRAGVEVELRPSSDPLEAARALRAGEVDVMWGGPLRVLIARDKDPASRPGLLLRRGGARSRSSSSARRRARTSSSPISCR